SDNQHLTHRKVLVAGGKLRTTLGELRAEQVDMRTLVIIGSSTTCSFPRADGEAWVYTPRWYPSE
ncbi:hypothetical protein K3Z84_18570, partial [Pseudomonas aeruginosa]|nr:hypothetical protein [Pseudomonas aeruginosa]